MQKNKENRMSLSINFRFSRMSKGMRRILWWENLAESLAGRPIQEVGEDIDLVEECDHAGPSKQREKDQVVLMLLSSDEEEQQSEDREGLFKGHHKKQYRTAAMVEKARGELSKAAKRIQSIPSTTTPSERIFSKAGFIISKTRSTLLPANVNKLVFLAHNLKRLKWTQDK